MEVMILVVVTLVIAAVGIPFYLAAVDEARVDRAKQQIRIISMAIDTFQARKGGVILPQALSDVGYGGKQDPWGRPYMYLNFQTGSGSSMKYALDNRLVDQAISSPDTTSIGDALGFVTLELAPQDKKRLMRIVRMDKHDLPLNSDYDLYSIGPDGFSAPSVKHPSSFDDLVRAKDGTSFVKASEL